MKKVFDITNIPQCVRAENGLVYDTNKATLIAYSFSSNCISKYFFQGLYVTKNNHYFRYDPWSYTPIKALTDEQALSLYFDLDMRCNEFSNKPLVYA